MFNPNLFNNVEDPRRIPPTSVPVTGVNDRFSSRLKRETLLRQGVPAHNDLAKTQQFKTQDDHNNFYIKRILDFAKTKNPDKYELYFKLLNSGDKDGAMSILALLGSNHPEVEIPRFNPQPQPPYNPGPSRILDIGTGLPQVHGYRYNAGQGLPARQSITNNIRKRRRF